MERGDAERRDGVPPNVQQFQRWDVLHMRYEIVVQGLQGLAQVNAMMNAWPKV